MNTRLLIPYATKAGSTADVAQYIGQTLRELNFEVDVIPVENAPEPSAYHGVLCGSAIRASAWLPEMTAYVETHREVLAQKTVVYWAVCLTLEDDTPENRETVAAYLAPVREILTPQAEGFFAGVMEVKKLSFPVRMLIKAMKAPSGDFRDWRAIRDWALSLEPLLRAQPTEPAR